jgi:hypothetical protein
MATPILAVPALTPVPVAPLTLERFRAVLDPRQWAEVEAAQARSREIMAGRVVWSVNSTAFGGGVAEMLRSLIGTRAARAWTRGGSWPAATTATPATEARSASPITP